MAQRPERYTGIDPNGETSVMSKITVSTAGFLHLADIPSTDYYTLRLWIKAGAGGNVTCYIGSTPYVWAVTTSWQRFTQTTTATQGGSCELYLPAGTYYIWHPMLERSTKASDWRPAPEDTENDIKSAADNALAEAKEYTNQILIDYVTTDQMQSEIRQTQEEISLSVSRQTSRAMSYADAQSTAALNAARNDTDIKLQGYVTTSTYSAAMTLLNNSISSTVQQVSELITYTGYNGDPADRISAKWQSDIRQTADNITSTVAATYATLTTVNGISGDVSSLTNRVTIAESSITQNAEQIALRVTKAGLITEINASTEAITLSTAGRLVISAGNFQLDGSGNATLTGGVLQSSAYVTTSGSYGMKIDLTNSFIDSANFKVDSQGNATLSNATFTGGTIRSSNYVAGTGGMRINLSTGAISTISGNFSVSSTGVLTAKFVNLTGTITSTSSNEESVAKLNSGRLNYYFRTHLVCALGIYENDSEVAAGLIGGYNTDRIKMGLYTSGDTTYTSYYSLNRSIGGSVHRHDFTGTVGMSGTLYGSNATLSGTLAVSGVSTFNNQVNVSNHHLNFDTDYGIKWGGNIGLRYTNDISPSGVWLGIAGNGISCPTVITGSEIRFKVTAYTNAGVVVTSDRRLKKGIKDLDTRYTKLLENLSGKAFQYTEYKPEQTNCGFVAQDVITAMNKAGLEPKDFGALHDHYGDGSEYSLDYVQFIPILWDIVRNQQSIIDELRRRLS